MIDTFQTVARWIAPLRYPAVALGLACLAVLVFIVLGTPAAGGHDRYLVPALVGFIWCLSAYGFIDTFQSVPERADERHGFSTKLKLNLLRGWYWLLAILFAVSTLAALFLTLKLGSFWLGEYYG